MQMRGQIAVAEIEPGRLAEARHVGEGVEVRRGGPSPGRVEGAGKRIADRVEVRGAAEHPQTRASSPASTITVSLWWSISRASP